MEYDAGLAPSAVAVGDFDRDGIPDLAVAHYDNGAGGTVSVLLGHGDGGFAPEVEYEVVGDPYAVAVGDFNGDGLVDIAVTIVYVDGGLYSGSLHVLLANGDGGFGAPESFGTGFFPDAVAVGDFNRDGLADLAVANDWGNSVSVLLGHGDGGFEAESRYGTGVHPASLAVSDFNRDGIPDLVVADYGGSDGGAIGTAGVLLGWGDGGFGAEVEYTAGAAPYSVTAADFDGDGIPDIVVANGGSNPDGGTAISVLRGMGNGGFESQVQYSVGSSPPDSVAVGDFNGDGLNDIAVSIPAGDNTVDVLMANRDGGFADPVNFGTGSNPAAVAVADFNRDGKPDLATANSANFVSVLLNTSPSAGCTFISMDAGD